MPERDWKNGLESEPVTTYVSTETKKIWKEHAENMEVSLSRFVEMMVNAGRSMHSDSVPEGYEEQDPVSVEREKEALERRLRDLENVPEPDEVLDIYSKLKPDEYTRVEELSETLDREEAEVYESLQALMDEELVEYDTMKNGYRRT